MPSVLDLYCFLHTLTLVVANNFLSTADPHRDRLSNTNHKPSAFMLDTKAAGQSPTTHGSYEVSDQCVASRDRHTSDNAATPSLRNSTTSRLHSTRGHSHDTSLPGLSALGHHVTNQAQIDLVMERYLGEKDRYKEFLVGCQDERGHQSQVVAPNLKEWNRRWNEITQLRNTHEKPKL